MKKFFTKKHAKIIYLLLITVPLRADNATMRVMFDTLFPVSPFKAVLTHCMQVRNALEVLRDYHGEREDYDMLCDIMAGRMAYLETALKQFVDAGPVAAQDVEYLLTILAYMDHEVVHAFKNKTQAPMLHMQSIVASIKIRLESCLGQ